MNAAVKQKLCDTICFALNTFWTDKARVETINSSLFWFTVTYSRDFDARHELNTLGIDYNEHPKNWVRDEYVQDFFMSNAIWEKVCERWKNNYSK